VGTSADAEALIVILGIDWAPDVPPPVTTG